jgi:hypothetical protein
MRQQKAWSVPCKDLDHSVISRPCALAQCDIEMSERIRDYWARRKSDQVDEAQVLATQLAKAEAQIERLDRLLTAPAVSLSPETEKRYIEMLRDVELDMQRLLKKRAELSQYEDPERVLADFYTVLARLPTEYKRLTPANRKRIAQQVIGGYSLEHSLGAPLHSACRVAERHRHLSGRSADLAWGESQHWPRLDAGGG